MGAKAMGNDDRMERAGNYVRGLLDDRERARAERDLELDPAFREAVVEQAERMHVLHRPASAAEGPRTFGSGSRKSSATCRT